MCVTCNVCLNLREKHKKLQSLSVIQKKSVQNNQLYSQKIYTYGFNANQLNEIISCIGQGQFIYPKISTRLNYQ